MRERQPGGRRPGQPAKRGRAERQRQHLGNVTATGGDHRAKRQRLHRRQRDVNGGTLTIGQAGGGHLTVGGGMNVGGSSSLVAGSTAAAISGNLNYTSSSNSTFSGAILGAGVGCDARFAGRHHADALGLESVRRRHVVRGRHAQDEQLGGSGQRRTDT